MPCHSEEIWETFDAMWHRVQTLSRQVKELEARLALLEAPCSGSSKAGFKAICVSEEAKLTSALQRRE